MRCTNARSDCSPWVCQRAFGEVRCHRFEMKGCGGGADRPGEVFHGGRLRASMADLSTSRVDRAAFPAGLPIQGARFQAARAFGDPFGVRAPMGQGFFGGRRAGHEGSGITTRRR